MTLNPRRAVLTFAAASSLALPCAGLHAQQEGPGPSIIAGVTAPEAVGVIDLPRLGGPVTLDGLSDEPAWEGIESLPLTMYNPTFRGESRRRVDLLVAYDDEAIYVAGRFYYDDINDLRAVSLIRDRYSGDDSFAVLLDTFNDNENAVRFNALPLGTRVDMTVTGDGENSGGGGAGGPRNTSWSTFWDLETQITSEGWFGEIRIPFSSLRFETEADGSVVMGLLGFVHESRVGGRWTFPAMPTSAPYQRVSGFQDVRLRNVEPQNPVYFIPYGLTGATRTSELSPAGDQWNGVSDETVELGADLKLNPTRNTTLDLTVNTDFAAVEADQQQVNLTRFSLFFDEKRAFFQERAGIFGFDTGADRGTLFYSRRIGLADGQPVRILGGARLVGRIGSWDLGVIDMQTAADGNLASENFGVLRARRQVLNPNSFVGAMTTSRLGSDGLYNVSYGLDALFRVTGDEYLTVKWLQTLQGGDASRNSAPSGLDAGHIVLDWTRRRLDGFSYKHALIWSGAGFDPAVGFQPRKNYSRVQSDWNYTWLPTAGSRLRRIWLGTVGNVWVRNADDVVDTGQFQPFLQLETAVGATLKASVNTTYEDVPIGFSLSDEVGILPGSYWATEGSIEFRAARGWATRPNLTLTAGEFYDGQRIGVSSDLNWNLNQYLEVVAGWEWNRIRFNDRGESLDTNLARLTARIAVDTHLSVDAFGQYNSLTEQVSTNTRVRYNFREGQDLWLVWNEGLNMERDVLGVPRLPLENARTLTLKYTHTLIL